MFPFVSGRPPGGGGVTDHGALSGLLDDDHTQYGALAQAETWALLQTFTTGIVAGKVTISPNAPKAGIGYEYYESAGADAQIGIAISIGLTTAASAGAIVGLQGYAISRTGTTTVVRGLAYAAGSFGVNLATAICVDARYMVYGAPSVLSVGYAYRDMGPQAPGTTITLGYSFAAGLSGACTLHHAFYDPNIPAAGTYSVLYPNLHLFSLTPSFAGGLGVLGIADASTNPTGTPAGGGALYSSAGALRWRGSAGTDTLIAPA